MGIQKAISNSIDKAVKDLSKQVNKFLNKGVKPSDWSPVRLPSFVDRIRGVTRHEAIVIVRTDMHMTRDNCKVILKALKGKRFSIEGKQVRVDGVFSHPVHSSGAYKNGICVSLIV